MDMAQNLLAALAPKQQDTVKSTWGELLNVVGGKENVAMELAKHTMKAQLGGGESSGGLGGMLSGVTKLFGGKKDKEEGAAAPTNPMDILSKVGPLVGGLDSPNALLGFFAKSLSGSGATEGKSESSIFKMLKTIIFGLLGDKLSPQSFKQNDEAQGAWSKFLSLAAGAIKNQA